MDYDSDSPFGKNWPRITSGKKRDDPNYVVMPMNCTHGAIGGCPGYSDDTPNGYRYDLDRKGSIDADTAVRTKAQQCGVPIKVLSPDDYGFPKRQDDLPRILPR